MKLYLVQHAKADVKAGETERTLTEEGIAELLKIASFLKIHARVSPHTIFHSEKIRAKQTADILAEHITPQHIQEVPTGLAPMDDPGEWVKKANELTDDCMIVGHMPHLSKLATTLLERKDDKMSISFRNSGVVCLQYIDNDWTLLWTVIPEILK
ncbi:MAG: phosphohistidine phosphatase SixA [Candidatus Zixiibacteriota bacterium]